MRRLVCAALVAASLTPALPRPAEAWWGPGGVLFGTAVGVTAGAIIGSAIVHPYPYAYYPYPYPYRYAYPYYPAPVYAVPYGYPPPAAYYYPPPAYAAPTPAPAAQPSGYVAPTARTPACGSGQFYNSLTGSCDQR